MEMTTFGSWLKDGPAIVPAPALAAGSWVYGTLSTWIGDRSKNRAWELLREAKRAVDRKLSEPALSAQERREIEQALAVCEGSDWFWWLGDYNPMQTVAEFDALYRRNLEVLYRKLGASPPAELGEPLSEGNGAPALGGVMRSSAGSA